VYPTLTPPRTAAAATTSNHSEEDAAADNDDDEDEATEDNTDKENEDIMPPKTILKKSPKTTTAGAKSNAPPVNVDSITSGIQGVTVTKRVKTPAFTSYSTKVEDPFMIRTTFIDGEQNVEFDVSIAAALLCGDGIEAVLASDGMGVSLHRGVYSSFFTNRRFRKDLGMEYNKDSSRVTAHRKVCDGFKKKESVRNGIMYGECQFVQLPCECTGLVEDAFTGRVQTPITI
jgi:hypothetical protein